MEQYFSLYFENAQLANIDEPAKRKEWRNPDHHQNYIDTYRFQAEVMVTNIAYFTKIVKEKSDGNLLTGAFYGYHYYVGDPNADTVRCASCWLVQIWTIYPVQTFIIEL